MHSKFRGHKIKLQAASVCRIFFFTNKKNSHSSQFHIKLNFIFQAESFDNKKKKKKKTFQLGKESIFNKTLKSSLLDTMKLG